ncbi:hypothetical protein BHE74_00024026, partial [Ensete ventricosum]
SVDTSCGRPGNWTGIMGAGPISASDIAFNSLPPMHFNGDGNFGGSNSTFLPAGMIGEEISKSCPLPASSVPAKEVPAPVAAPLRNSKKYFAPHWSEQAVEEAIEAYCTIDGLLVDVLINGVSSQNRAMEGDIVAVMLEPVAYWTKLKGLSVRSSPVASCGSDTLTEASGVIDNNDAKNEQVDAHCNSSDNTLPMDNGDQNHENSGFSESVSSDLGNRYMTSDSRYNRCNHSRASTNSAKNGVCQQGEAARALERICAMISSNQSKRPTGRVLSIIRNSPRREAVIGFLALKPWLPEGEENVRLNNGQLSKKNKEPVFSAGLDYIQLIPTDSKFPKMVVTVRNLPGCAKERLMNGDVSIEKELVAARIDEWNEESLCPEVQVMHILGRGFEVDGFGLSGKSVPELHGQFELKDVVNSIRSLHEISNKLREIRFKDGALGLENPKLVILFDENGTPYDSFLKERKESCSLVEELMLLANKSVAEVISRAFPDCALLRRHPEPNLRKLKEFEAFCSKYGFELDASSSGKLHLSLSKIREELKNDPVLFDILISYASKPMQSATYFCSGDLRGREYDWAHYGLSIPLYTHFTSPLRRYSDILVHRTLSAVVEAEEVFSKQRESSVTADDQIYGDEIVNKCFTGLYFDKDAAESDLGREALLSAAMKYKVPGSEVVSEVAAYCNERKRASKYAEESGEKLYLWTLLRNKELERRIYYDEIEGLAVEWLETTGTLILDIMKINPFQRRGFPGKLRVIEDVALLLSTSQLVSPEEDNEYTTAPSTSNQFSTFTAAENNGTAPCCFPLVIRHLSTIPVALYAVGGHDGPVDIMARLYVCSYFK